MDKTIRAVIHELRTYNPAADEYRGEHIHHGWADRLEAAAPVVHVTDDMLDRFLGWKLPADFSPDCGITFKRVHSENSPFGPQAYKPVGTNLLNADQARAMLEHVLGAVAQPSADPVTWRCFHCDEFFTDKERAAIHFGHTEYDKPACQFNVEHIRWMEAQHRRNVDDDSEALRTVRSLAGAHEALRRRAEEEGYAKGLADAKKHPEELGLIAASPTVAKALEFAEYMAKAGVGLIERIQALSSLQAKLNDGDGVPDDQFESAWEKVNEWANSLCCDIYEFRKRAAKVAALQLPPPATAQLSEALQPIPAPIGKHTYKQAAWQPVDGQTIESTSVEPPASTGPT